MSPEHVVSIHCWCNGLHRAATHVDLVPVDHISSVLLDDMRRDFGRHPKRLHTLKIDIDILNVIICNTLWVSRGKEDIKELLHVTLSLLGQLRSTC